MTNKASMIKQQANKLDKTTGDNVDKRKIRLNKLSGKK